MYTFSLFMWYVGHSQMNSGASSLEAEGYLFWDILEVIIPRGVGRTEPASVAAGVNWQAGLRCPHLSLLSGVGKSLLGRSGNFLVVYIPGLRNTNIYSEKMTKQVTVPVM